MLERLKKRKEFLEVAASGGKVVTRSVVLQYRSRTENLPDSRCRVGFTVTKRQGNAVVRNRIRRRLREAFRLAEGNRPMPGWDFVAIGRHTAASCDFGIIVQDMGYALKRLQRERRGNDPRA